MKRSGIYQIINRINGKRYIGSAACFQQRFSMHRLRLRRGEHHSPHLQASWNKYGEFAFKFAPLLVCSRAALLMYEQRLIDAYTPEYNVCPTAASWLGHKHTPESCARMSASRTGKKLSSEHVANMSRVRKGKKLSPERIAALVNARLGKPLSAETRAKISQSRLGKKLPPEVCAKMSASRTGKKLPPRSPETLARMSKAQTARWARVRFS